MPRWKMNSLGAWEETEEYISPRAGTVYKAPKPTETAGDKLRKEGVGEDGGYIDSGELAPDGTVQESRMFDIDPKKHKTQQKQKKIRNIAEQGATAGEKEAGKRKLKDQTDLPNFLQVHQDADPIIKEGIAEDQERYGKTDQLIREGKLDEVYKQHPDIVQQANQFYEDTGAGGYNRQRQKLVDSSAQFVDDTITKISGSEKLGDFVRPISGFIVDTAWPTAEEIALTGVASALSGPGAPVVGGATYAALKAQKWLDIAFDSSQHILKRVANKKKLQLAAAGNAGGNFQTNTVFKSVGSGGGGSKVVKNFGQSFVPPNPSEIHKVTQKLLNENVLYGKDRRFNYNAFKGLYTGKGGSKKARQLEILMQTTPHSKIPNWNTHRQGLVDVFESLYGDVMSLKKIPRSRIHIDHLVTLRSTMPIYDDVAFGSPLWNNIQETLLNSKKKYKPGNTLDNLSALDPGSHTVKTNFFNDRIGKDGSKFFTKEKVAFMKKSDANRLEVLKEFIEIQDEGTEILNQATKVWEDLYHPGAALPKQIVEKLSKIPIGKYSHPELKNLDELKKIIDDIVTSEAETAIKNINKGYKQLSDRIQNPNLKMRVKSPTKLEKKLERLGKPEGITKDTAQRNLFEHNE